MSYVGEAVGELWSAGWGFEAGRCVDLCCLRGDAAKATHHGTPLMLALWAEPVTATARDA